MKAEHIIGFILLLAAALLTILGGLHTGTIGFSTADILAALTGGEVEKGFVITDIRLPRSLLALFTGAILALGGFFMQALIKNPLADPYIMGLTSGAAFGVNLVILGLIPLAGIAFFSFPVAAFLGGLLSLVLVLGLGFRSLMEDSARLLIAGVAVAAVFTALTGLMIYTLADSNQIQQILFWSFGSFGRADWESAGIAGVLLIVSLLFGLSFSRRMDILILGDLQARTLGMEVPKVKFALLLVTSLTVGGTVAFTGPIGFVGMMIPHFCRSMFGGAHRPNMILGALMGGAFLAACDLLSRWILPPAGLPIGILTAIIGVPFFLYVLFSKKSYL